MNVQPITDYRLFSTTKCTHEKGKTPPAVNLPKPPIEVKNQDKFVREQKDIPVKNGESKNRRLSVMFSSGGGTN